MTLSSQAIGRIRRSRLSSHEPHHTRKFEWSRCLLWIVSTSPITFGQSGILVDHDGHARLTDFEFVPIVHGMNSATQVKEYTVAWAAPEILEGTNTTTREADVFAFGMVVIEVGPCVLPLVLEVEG